MTTIGWFSTDFTSNPVEDKGKTLLAGRRVYQPGKSIVSYGGTFYHRGAMPAMEMDKHDEWTSIISWKFRSEPGGEISVMDRYGEWFTPDVFYSQRWMHEDGEQQMLRARATGQRIVADLDDDFWSLGKTNIAYHTTDPKNNPQFNRDHYWRMLSACDAITVSTEALRKRVEKLGVATYVLRNAIDIRQWQQNDPAKDGMIGWIGGIQWRAHDLHILRAIGLPAFLKHYDLPMYHGGDSDVEGVPKFYQQIGINPMETKCVVAPLCHVAEYPRLWAPLNISLIPLEKVAFNQSKSWLKQLESCASGLPYIVSAGFHEQDLLISEGTAGRTAKNEKPQQWIDHLTDLLDPMVRRAEGAINRKVAEQHDISLKWVDWDAAYKAIVKG